MKLATTALSGALMLSLASQALNLVLLWATVVTVSLCKAMVSLDQVVCLRPCLLLAMVSLCKATDSLCRDTANQCKDMDSSLRCRDMDSSLRCRATVNRCKVTDSSRRCRVTVCLSSSNSSGVCRVLVVSSPSPTASENGR